MRVFICIPTLSQLLLTTRLISVGIHVFMSADLNSSTILINKKKIHSTLSVFVGCFDRNIFLLVQNVLPRVLRMNQHTFPLSVAQIRQQVCLRVTPRTFQRISEAALFDRRYLQSPLPIFPISRLGAPRGLRRRGRSKLLVGRAVTIKGGRSVKTSPVLPGWAKVLLKRFF